MAWTPAFCRRRLGKYVLAIFGQRFADRQILIGSYHGPLGRDHEEARIAADFHLALEQRAQLLLGFGLYQSAFGCWRRRHLTQ